MSGPGEKPTRRPGARLSEEDVALWRHVTRSVTASTGKSRVPEQAAEASAMPEAAVPGNASSPAAPLRKIKQALPSPPAPTRPPEPVRPMPLERRKARRIAKGGQEIEARLDLHGLTQDEAHGALEHFIYRCTANGLRTVLVITGKGASGRDEAHAADGYQRRERGVLKRMVPLWLDSPSLRPLVIGYAAAHARHGGQGALYVTLRRNV